MANGLKWSKVDLKFYHPCGHRFGLKDQMTALAPSAGPVEWKTTKTPTVSQSNLSLNTRTLHWISLSLGKGL